MIGDVAADRGRRGREGDKSMGLAPRRVVLPVRSVGLRCRRCSGMIREIGGARRHVGEVGAQRRILGGDLDQRAHFGILICEWNVQCCNLIAAIKSDPS